MVSQLYPAKFFYLTHQIVVRPYIIFIRMFILFCLNNFFVDIRTVILLGQKFSSLNIPFEYVQTINTIRYFLKIKFEIQPYIYFLVRFSFR